MYKTYNCVVCGIESRFKHSKTNIFCSISCQQRQRYLDYIKEWKEGNNAGGNKYGVSNHLKRYLLEKYNNTCSECGIKDTYNGKLIVLEVDHIDGNPYNNKEENLRTICPNCHSQSDNYKAKNKGNGRAFRSKYYEYAGVAQR